MMNKIVVPHLFEIETRVSNIYGFSLFDLAGHQKSLPFQLNNNYLKQGETYFYEINKNIDFPERFDAFYRWYSLADKRIYYQRSIMGNISLKLEYDLVENRIIVNPAYHHLVRFELGNIWPAGKILANFIIDDLQNLGFGTFHGMAFRFKNRVICVFAPGGNFKTPLIKALMTRGAEYISGDKIIIKDGDVYFLPPLKSDKIPLDYDKMVIYKYKITDVFFVFRSKSGICKDLKSIDVVNSYLNSFSLFNFLGTGWALNFRRIINKSQYINDWYNFLGFEKIKNVKLIKEENFKDLVNLFLKKLI